MEPETPTKCGWLLSAPQGKFRKKSWQRRYYALYKASSTGIARLEMFTKSEGYKNKPATKIFSLENCIKILADPQDNLYTVFTITTKTHSYTLAAQSPKEFKEWLEAVRSVAFGDKTLSPVKEPSPVEEIADTSQIEDNLIYTSLDLPNTFPVQIQESALSNECKLTTDKIYILKLANESLDLYYNDGVIYQWPLHHIRRFGHTPRGFSLEAGRRCETGEGKLHFITMRGKELFEEVDKKIKVIHLNEEKYDEQVRNKRFGGVMTDFKEKPPISDRPKCPPVAKVNSSPISYFRPKLPFKNKSESCPVPLQSSTLDSAGPQKVPVAKPPRYSLMKHRSSLGNTCPKPEVSRRKVSSESKDSEPPQPPLRSSVSPSILRNSARNTRSATPSRRDSSPYDIPRSPSQAWESVVGVNNGTENSADSASDHNDGYEDVGDFKGSPSSEGDSDMKSQARRSSTSSFSSGNSPKNEVPHVTKGEHIYAVVNKVKSHEKINGSDLK